MGGVIGRGADEPAPAGEPVEDWTTVDAGAVETARELSRLAALHGDDVLSAAEFVAAVRARLGAP